MLGSRPGQSEGCELESRIKEVPEGLLVEISDPADRRQALLETFTACREGRCSCPTDEYGKLESLEVEEGDGGLRVRLRAKAGETFQVSEIERCLEYNGVEKGKDSD